MNQPAQQQEPPGRTGEMNPRPDHGEESYRGPGRLAGKAAVITGADSGVGRAVAIAFAWEGADVLIAYLGEHDNARETARWVEQAGRKAVLVPGDLAEAAHCRSVIDSAVAEFGRIDVLVSNAAQHRAVIATWVRAESIWRADCVGRSPAVRTLADVTGHVNAHSVTEAATPGHRLAALAAYLGLDWPWLRRRCADLGQHGCAGLARPRSRLLSTEAVDAALRFASMLGHDAAVLPRRHHRHGPEGRRVRRSRPGADRTPASAGGAGAGGHQCLCRGA